VEVWQTYNLRPLRLGQEKKYKKKKKKKENTEQKYNVRRAAIIKSESANASLMSMSALYACEKLSRGRSPLGLSLNHRTQAWFYIWPGVKGQLPINLGFTPQIFQHTGAKRSVPWP